MKAFLIFNCVLMVMAIALSARAVRLKDIANVRGVRSNQLIGYGLVVGLNGTGDSKVEFTSKSMVRMLDKLGVKLNNKEISSKNIAAVLVTADLPAFSRAGNRIDVTVNSIGDASDLRGGTLIQTPLRAANQQIFAVAQGSLLIGQEGSNQPTVARVVNGAIIEKEMADDFSNRKMFRITLHKADFTTAARVVKALNQDLGGQYATAVDAGTIDLVVPFSYEGRGVQLLASIEALDISPDLRAKVVINEKTGTVIIGDRVKISRVAISHGDLSVEVGGTEGQKKKKAKKEKVAVVSKNANVGDLVKAMNRLGVSPKDLITILQSIKAAGALHGELEVL